MQLTLIHNPTAGDGEPSAAALLEALSDAGYQPRYCSTKEGDLDAALVDPGDFVAVAGGDGTVRKVATRLAGLDVAMALLPLGTANNISRSLGIRGDPFHQIAAWPSARRYRIDVGTTRGRWGESRFVEGVGCGAFPVTIAALSKRKQSRPAPDLEPRAELRRDRRLLERAVLQCPAFRCRVSIDGEELQDDYVMIEVLNTPRFGPKLRLAPEADPGDGLLDVVLVSERERSELAAYVARRPAKQPPPMPFSTRVGRHVLIEGAREPMHIDDKLWPKSPWQSSGAGPNDPSAPALGFEVALEGLYVDVILPAWADPARGSG